MIARRALAALLCALALVIGAAPVHAAGILRATAPGPVELTQEGLDYRGTFVVENAGDGPLLVERVQVRTSAEDPRTPPGVSAEIERATEPMLRPGERRKVTVRWRTAAARARELYGHVLVIAEPPEGGEERIAAMGVHTERGRGLGWIGDHALSLLVLLPLLGAVGAGLARGARAGDPRLRVVPVVAHGAAVALALWVLARFDAGFGRADGNEGLQFIERGALVPSLGVEYFVGVDGVSISLVVLAALVGFSAALLRSGEGGRPWLDVAVAALLGVFVAQDLLIFLASFVALLLSLALALGGGRTPEQQGAARRFARFAAVGAALLALPALWLYQHGDPGFLLDGTAVARSAALPELARVAWLSKGLSLFGLSAVKVVWSALFVAFALFLPLWPLHAWMPDALAEAKAPARVLLAGGLAAAAGYGLLRINAGLLPQATVWAAPAVAALGALNVVAGAASALAQRDLARLCAFASVSRAGFVLLGLGALTPQGIQAAVVQLSQLGLVAALLLVAASAVMERSRARELDQLSGLARDMPRGAALLALAMLASVGLPGLSGLWGELLAMFGALPRYPLFVAFAAVGMVLAAAYHARALGRLLPGEPQGRADVGARALVAAAPLAALVILLGVWPRPLLALSDRAALDLHRRLDPPAPTQIAMAGGGRSEYTGPVNRGVAHDG